MKRISILSIMYLLAAMGVWAQDDIPYRVIDTTMVFSEADFTVETNRRGLNQICHVPEDPSFSYMDHDLEKAWLLWWSPIFTLQPDERIATVDCVSCELEDEVLFMDSPQLGGKSTTKPFDEDAPTLPCYAYYTNSPNGRPVRLLSELAALSEDYLDYLYAVHYPLVKVCPFRYDSESDKLYLYKKVRLKIRLAERPINKYVQEGFVRDQDGKPIPNALLTFADTKQYRTDADGHYQLVVETWETSVRGKLWVTADGYTSYYDVETGCDFLFSESNISSTQNFQLFNALNFKVGHLCTVILPITPDSSLGRYFRLDRVEDNNIVFERDFSPKAYFPYILIPERDARLELAGMELKQDTIIQVTASNNAAGFYGAFYSFSDYFSRSKKRYPLDSGGSYPGNVEAMHATLYYPYEANWGLILHDPDDETTAIHNFPTTITHQSPNHQYYDLSGRRVSVPSDSSVSSLLPKGVYIKDGKKVVVK